MASQTAPALIVRRSRSRGWDADDVALHLMQRKDKIIGGLRGQMPFVGIDEQTLESLFNEAVAVVARTSTKQATAWKYRSSKQLERGLIAAFRIEARNHWRVSYRAKRVGDRSVVSFDGQLHSPARSDHDALFAEPDLVVSERDMLADLNGEVREFWKLVFNEQLQFKEAGDRLGLDKATVMAFTRHGRAAFERYLDARASGDLCLSRARDILSTKAGEAPPWQAERAAAHLEICLPCALVHEPGASAIQRGLIAVVPAPLVAAASRVSAWAHDLNSRRTGAAAGGGALAGAGAIAGKTATVVCSGLICATAGAGGVELGLLPNPLPRKDKPPAEAKATSPAKPKARPPQQTRTYRTAPQTPPPATTTTTTTSAASTAGTSSKRSKKSSSSSTTGSTKPSVARDKAAAQTEFASDPAPVSSSGSSTPTAKASSTSSSGVTSIAAESGGSSGGSSGSSSSGYKSPGATEFGGP